MESEHGSRRHGRVRHSHVRVGPSQFADHLEGSGDPPVRHTNRFVHHCLRRKYWPRSLKNKTRRDSFVGHTDSRNHVKGRGTDRERLKLYSWLRSTHRQRIVATRTQLKNHCANTDLCRRHARRRKWAWTRTTDLRRQSRRARRSHFTGRKNQQRHSYLESYRSRFLYADAVDLQGHSLRAREQRHFRCLQSEDSRGNLPAM